MAKKQYTFTLDDDVVEAIRQLAKEQGRSLSGQIEFTLRQSLKIRK
jgi:hypothetical protein